MARVERRFAIPGLIARVGGAGRDFAVIANNCQFLIVQGLLGIGNFAGGTLRLAIPAIVLGFLLGIFIGLGPAGAVALDPRGGHRLRGVLPRRAPGHGHLLDVVHHPAAPAPAHSRSTAWPSPPS